jgi:UDP-4-amino-4,6-dideoxy-N-acetyl-beta-L-altrosamine N-acetyltransferase
MDPVALRPITAADRDTLLRWRNLPDVRRYMYTDHTITAAEHEAWFGRLGDDPTRQYWIITAGAQDVGVAHLSQLDERHRRCHWGLYLAEPSSRGRGVGSCAQLLVLREVFERRRLRRLMCEVLATNAAARRLYESFGFKAEGVLRAHVVKAEGPVDVISLALLREEWLATRSELASRLVQRGLSLHPPDWATFDPSEGP